MASGKLGVSFASDDTALVAGLAQHYVKRVKDEDLDAIVALGGEERIFQILEASPRGLRSEAQVQSHRERFGPNTLPRKETSPLWKLMWLASSDPMLRILIVASIVSFALALSFGENKKVEWIEGFAIFVAVMIVICVTAGNDFVKEKRFAALYDHEERWVQVIRDNEKTRILKEHVVAGDVIYIEAGDELPADGLLIQGHGVKVDESALTGEPDHITKEPFARCEEKRDQVFGSENATHNGEKSDRCETQTTPDAYLHHAVPSPVLLSGSKVTSGSGHAMIIATGSKSQMGQLFSKLVVDNEPTPLQNKLNAMARDVGMTGFIAAVVTLAVLIIEYIVELTHGNEQQSVSNIVSTIVQYIVTAITIVVVAVPEGLPLAVTISLAFSVGRMLKDQNYVRRLAACETMGGASEVCSDKTGTLTKNQMEVETYWNGSQVFGDGQEAPRMSSEQPTVLSPSLSGLQEQMSFMNLMNNDSVSSGAIDDDLQKKDCSHGDTRHGGIPWPANLDCCLALLHNIIVNSSGSISTKQVSIGNDESKEISQQIGSPTDCALLGFANRHEAVQFNWIRSVFKGISPPDDRHLLNCGLIDTGADLCPAYKDMRSYVRLQVPFSSEKKVMTTICYHPRDPTMYRIYTKGAAEIVLRRCSFRVDSEGELRPLDADRIHKIESKVIQRFANIALRTICLGFVDVNQSVIDSELESIRNETPDPTHFFSFENNYICLGIVGIRDPLREEVPRALQDCKRAGVRVRMCTGDNIETAKQIALKAGIYKPELGGLAMLGPDFLKLVGGVVCKHCRTERCPCESGSTTVKVRDPEIPPSGRQTSNNRYNCGRQNNLRLRKRKSTSVREDVLGLPEEFASIADRLEVLARSQPSDKYALVTGLKNLGRVVAVTGDGTNDAPALKKADVGFAMGITGKETAKQAADIVLMDDNFSSIVKAIKWGRNVYDNIQRFLQFQLTVNIVAVITAFTGACILRASPLTAVQLLWVNLIMDTFAAVALATEQPTDKLLNRPPHKRTEYLVSKAMWRNIIVQVTYQVLVMGFVIFKGDCWLPEFPFDHANADPNFQVYSTCGTNHVRSGRAFRPFTSEHDYLMRWTNDITPSRHFTYVFNIFVMMQAFNLVNSRKIDREWNIWSGLHRNPFWVGIITIIIVGQILIVQFGGRALNVHKNGLTWQQWLICLGFGVGSWVAAALGKLLPARLVETWVPESHNKEINPLTEPASLALASRGRINSGRISSRMNLPAVTPGGHLTGTAYLQPPLP